MDNQLFEFEFHCLVDQEYPVHSRAFWTSVRVLREERFPKKVYRVVLQRIMFFTMCYLVRGHRLPANLQERYNGITFAASVVEFVVA